MVLLMVMLNWGGMVMVMVMVKVMVMVMVMVLVMVDAEYLSLHRSDWRLRFGPNGVLSSVVAKNCFIHELHYLCLWRHLKDDSP